MVWSCPDNNLLIYTERREKMVQFPENENGFDVLVDRVLFGYLQKECGFCTGLEAVNVFLVVSPEDLITIAIKADEVKTHGNVIPVCPDCRGTPNFPGRVYSPNEGAMCCINDLHPFNIGYFWKTIAARVG